MKRTELREFSRKIVHFLNIILPLVHVYLIKDRMDMLIFISLIAALTAFN